MKKFILLSAALFACGALYAENMRFVTLLSSPLGTFSRLETADPAVYTKSKFVNFATTKVGTGQIDLIKKAPVIGTLHLASGTTLTSSTLAAYYTSGRFEIGSGGTVEGKSLLATNLSYEGSTSAKSEVGQTLTLANTGKFVGGYAGSMNVGSGKAKTVASRPDNVGLDMHWSNVHKCEAYKTDGTCPSGKENTYAKSFVLKSKTSFDSPCEEGPKGASYLDFCPAGQTGSITMTWDTGLCAYKETNNTCKKTKKKCLTKRRWCKKLDVGTGALNDGGYNEGNLVECNRASAMHFSACAVSIGMYGGDDFNATFQQVPMGCSWGQECASCTLNAYYASSSNGVYCATCKNMAQYAYGPGSVRTIYSVAYAVCTELEDCAEGEEKTDCWNVGNGWTDSPTDVPLTPVPMDPNLQISL